MEPFEVRAASVGSITVTLDGEPVNFSQEPVMIDGQPMVPIREVAEMAGWKYTDGNSTVFELMKSVKYTDGVSDYLFSCHSVFINLEDMCINRSIMVGVGKYYETPNDLGIRFSADPVIENGGLLMSVNDIAECLYADGVWDASNQTVYITSDEIPYYDGQGLANRQELFDGMRQYYKAIGTLTRKDDLPASLSLPETPALSPAIMAFTLLGNTYTSVIPTPSPIPEPPFKPSGVVTSAPEEGSVPADILLPGKHDVMSVNSYYEPYKINVAHGCNWYAFGRFYETYGYKVSALYTGGKTYLDVVDEAQPTTVRAERNLDNITSGCIAVYYQPNGTGHVVFVEYVERDRDGAPAYIYYTECRNSDGSGVYKPESDAQVQRVTFERFMTSTSSLKNLMGLVVPAK